MVFAVDEEGPGSSSSETGTRSGSVQTLQTGSAIVVQNCLVRSLGECAVRRGRES